MKTRKLMKVTIAFAVVLLVAGFVITHVLAQGNGVGYQGNSKKGLQGDSSTQQGIMQQNRVQDSQLNECTGECDNCANCTKSMNQVNNTKQGNNANLKGQGIQGNQNKIDCNSCLPQTNQQGNMYGNQNQMNQMNQMMEEDCEYSVEISGQELKTSTIEQIAAQWGIDAQALLNAITKEFGLNGNYNTYNVLEDLRQEYRFTPAQIKTIAEDIKNTA